MREFFKPSRRKFGVKTLVMACAFMAGWVRSEVIDDYIGYSIRSRNGAIESVTLYESTADLFVLHVNEDGSRSPSIEAVLPSQNLPAVVSAPNQPIPTFLFSETIPWSVPYWVIVSPLTLVSAWLLSKPRSAKKP